MHTGLSALPSCHIPARVVSLRVSRKAHGLGKLGETLCASMRLFLPKPFSKCLICLESGVSLGSASLFKNLALAGKFGVPAVSRRQL